ncbi:MAG: rRNA maturation RNase YbeY [Treponema sp.]|jgi:probable rRNA maturation factor|nr:rRNA maturation RNase YbeY [Treponema sp.]
MNHVTVNAEEVVLPNWIDSMRGFALKVLEEIKRDNWELSILLCGDKTITALNSQYRNKSEPTDILSFNLGETVKDSGKTVYLPGDIVISLDTLRENARYFNASEDEELRRLLIHGILHLDGMDHETTDKEEPMLAFQEEILNKLKNEHIFPCGGKM